MLVFQGIYTGRFADCFLAPVVNVRQGYFLMSEIGVRVRGDFFALESTEFSRLKISELKSSERDPFQFGHFMAYVRKYPAYFSVLALG